MRQCPTSGTDAQLPVKSISLRLEQHMKADAVRGKKVVKLKLASTAAVQKFMNFVIAKVGCHCTSIPGVQSAASLFSSHAPPHHICQPLGYCLIMLRFLREP